MTTLTQDGYALFACVLSGGECDDLLGLLSGPEVKPSRAGARHLLSLPHIAALAHDARLRSIAAAALGPEAVPFRATLFNKSSRANWSVVWHQDTALPLQSRFDGEGWGPWSVKGSVLYAHAPSAALERVLALRVHLDDSTAENGPLRVVPGSHRRGVLSDEEVAAQAVGSVDCLVPRGGVLAMRPLLIHASARVTTLLPRRVLHIEYAESLEILPGIWLARA